MPEIIERYLDDDSLDRFESDFDYLMSAVKSYHGEIELAFRKGRVSVYFRGNSLATIHFLLQKRYRIVIHKRFFEGAGLETSAYLVRAGQYVEVEGGADYVHGLLRRPNINKLMKAIRDVNHSEELTFEQILITDNPPAPGFLLIDRQVRDTHMKKRLDLLGLRRLESGRYGFVVIEVKLGKNAELSEAVATQLQEYVDHIREPEHAEAYARCYEKTYEQKRRLGLIDGEDMPPTIEIDGSHVEGLVVVGGYSQQAEKQKAKLRKSHPHLRVHIFRNDLLTKGGELVG